MKRMVKQRKGVKLTPPKTKRIDPAKVAAALGAEPMPAESILKLRRRVGR